MTTKKAKAKDPLAGAGEAAQAAWLALEAEQRPEDFDRLAATVCCSKYEPSMARLEALAARRDPRLARRLVELAAAPPFTARSTEPFWGVFFRALRELGDASLAGELDEIADRYMQISNTIVGQHIQDRLRACAVKLRGGAPRAVAADQKSEADLLADVYAHPDEDGPRLVYADWLSEKGDPRGELIVLQINKPAGAEARIAELLTRTNREKWLGSLLTIAWGAVYRRGFPAVVRIPNTAPAVKRTIGDPAWATIEEVIVGYAPDAALKPLAKLMSSPPLSRVRSTVVPVSVFLGASPFPPVERLKINDVRAEHAAALAARLAAMTSLRSLTVGVGAWDDPMKHAWLVERLPVPGLVEFGVGNMLKIGAWLLALQKLPVPTVRIDYDALSFRFVKDQALVVEWQDGLAWARSKEAFRYFAVEEQRGFRFRREPLRLETPVAANAEQLAVMRADIEQLGGVWES